jgi:hypothetical protein
MLKVQTAERNVQRKMANLQAAFGRNQSGVGKKTLRRGPIPSFRAFQEGAAAPIPQISRDHKQSARPGKCPEFDATSPFDRPLLWLRAIALALRARPRRSLKVAIHY